MALNLKKSTSTTEPATQETKLDADVTVHEKYGPLLEMPILGRGGGRGRPFNIGVAKARTILLYLEEITEFVRMVDDGELTNN